MAGLNLGQDYQKAEVEDRDFKPVPAGEYVLQVTDSEIKESRAGTNYLKFEYTISDGEFKGRKVWDMFNINHAKDQVRQIAFQQLKSLAISCGHQNPNGLQDSEELHGKVFKAKLKIEESDGYDPQNKVRSYLKPATSTSPSEAPASGSNPLPWAK